MKQPSVHDERNLLIAILAAGLVLRLALVIYVSPYPERYIQTDAIGYNQLALNLLSGHGFSRDSTVPFRPDNLSTPIYPLTIAICYSIFGYMPASVLWLQAVLGTFTILLVYYLGKFAINPTTGLLSAALFAISPASIIYSAELWSETEYTFFLGLSALFTILMITRQQFRWILLGGLTAGIATLIHPRSLYLPALFAILLFTIRLKNRATIKNASVHAGIYIVIYALTLLPWLARNDTVFGVPTVTSAPGINMLDYGAALTEASQTGEDRLSIANRYDAEVRASPRTPNNEAEFSELALRLAMSKIAQNPLGYARVHLTGMAKTLLPITLSANALLNGQVISLDMAKSIYSVFIVKPFDRYNAIVQTVLEFPITVWIYIVLETIYLICIYLSSALSLVISRRFPTWTWFFGFIIFYLAAVAGPVGEPRFRVAMMPFFSVLAAIGLIRFNQAFANIWNARHRKRRHDEVECST